jgi:hypothetical protein
MAKLCADGVGVALIRGQVPLVMRFDAAVRKRERRLKLRRKRLMGGLELGGRNGEPRLAQVHPVEPRREIDDGLVSALLHRSRDGAHGILHVVRLVAPRLDDPVEVLREIGVGRTEELSHGRRPN